MALTYWQNYQKLALDDIESAHHQVGGVGPGRRYRTQQLNYAYIVMLAAQFQLFCRSLHNEAAKHLSDTAAPQAAASAILAGLTQGRALDRGNANPGTIGDDFYRVGLGIWIAIDSRDKRNKRRQKLLDQLNVWRNGVAHHNFSWSKEQQKTIGDSKATLPYIRQWRHACEALAIQIDGAVRDHLQSVTGQVPW